MTVIVIMGVRRGVRVVMVRWSGLMFVTGTTLALAKRQGSNPNKNGARRDKAIQRAELCLAKAHTSD